MKTAIWGAGLYGGRFAAGLGRDNIDFFIDQDNRKKTYAGKTVVHPSTINEQEWSEMFIYVPFNYYSEIKVILEAQGLEESKDFTVFYDKLRVSDRRAREDFRRYKSDVDSAGIWDRKTIVWGRFWQKKEYIDFISRMRAFNNDLALVSEAVWFTGSETNDLSGMPAIVAPVFADEDAIVINRDTTMCLKYKDERLFKLESDHMACIHKNEDYVSCSYTVNLIYEYLIYTIEHLKIRSIICLDSTTPHHILLADICRQKNIEIIFSHQGVIPGTISIDTTGEVGESVPAIMAPKFIELPVSEGEIKRTACIISHLAKSRMNRKHQPQTDWRKKTERCLLPERRPILLYAGQNDVRSHMVPYTERAREFFSPVFKSTAEALLYLAKLCRKNRWNLIYKPHPMYTNAIIEEEIPNNVIYIPFGDINEMIDYCDVMITILSTANYISLIRKTPVVMLGFNQVRGKNCTYEAFEKKDIEVAIYNAVKNGYTKEQEEAFTKHVAQLLKYYLYDDLQPRDLRYGKPVAKKMDDFYGMERLLKE